MRITQSMVMNSYTSRLGKTFESMDIATQKLTDQRKFLTAAEDPASTARAYQLRKNHQRNDDYLNNVKDILDTLDTVDASIMVVSHMAESVHINIELAKNGPLSIDERRVYANEIRSMQKSAVDALNTQFDDKFLFGGSSTKKPPFELTTDPTSGAQKLTFRGLDVTSSDPQVQAQLAEMMGEKIYVDIGLGLYVSDTNMGTNNGLVDIKDNTAYNVSVPGLSFLGFGTDPTDNLILNMGKIADALEEDPLPDQPIDKLWDKLTVQRKTVLLSVTKIGADYQFLQARKGVLEKNNDSLNAKILNVEYMEMEEGIANMKMADYVYRASLEVGARILTPSFIDFMK